MTKTSKSQKGFPLVIVAIGVLGVGALAGYAKFGPANRVPSDELRAEARPIKDTDPSSNPGKVKVLTPVYTGDDLTFKEGHRDTPVGQDDRVFAVNEYLKTISAVPTEAKVLTCKIQDGIATLDFTPAFEAGYGTEDERTIIEGILTVLGQFKDIEAVQFTSNGKVIESLGNIDLTVPQRVTRLDPVPPSKPTP